MFLALDLGQFVIGTDRQYAEPSLKLFSTYDVFAAGLRIDVTTPQAMSAMPNQVR